MPNTSFPQIKKTVFVVTYGRSGSTLIQNMLNSLPGYLIRGENDNLIAPLAQAWAIAQQSEQGSKMRELGRVTTPQNPWFGYEDVSEHSLGEALANSFTATILRPDANTRVTGFKEIRWHHNPNLFPTILTFISRFFPNARFIFNIRDHDQVIHSGWWKNMPESAVRKQLSEAESLYTDFSNTHAEQCITMHYNSYIIGVDAWRPLFEFLDEPFDPITVATVLGNKLHHMKKITPT